MALGKRVLAIAIEDRVDLAHEVHGDGEAVTGSPWSRPIPEAEHYLTAVCTLIGEALADLLDRQPEGQERGLFTSLDAIVVSIPGVVESNRLLRQLPLWNAPTRDALPWKGAPAFDVAGQLALLCSEQLERRGHAFDDLERQSLLNKVFVVNDATACAASEHKRRSELELEVEDFVYVKIHNGINAGVLGREASGRLAIRAVHAEAGHSLPRLHREDHDAEFTGTCTHHHACTEGMISAHSLSERATRCSTGYFAPWKRQRAKLERGGLSGQALDNALVSYLLGPASKGAAVGLVSHYAAQLVFQLTIGPLAPSEIVLGGRMATDAVIARIRQDVLEISGGYPARFQLTPAGISQHIVRSRSANPDDRTELEGALAIALSRADRSTAPSGPDGTLIVVNTWGRRS